MTQQQSPDKTTPPDLTLHSAPDIRLFIRNAATACKARQRIAEFAAGDGDGRQAQLLREMMTKDGIPALCPRKACRRAKLYSTPHAWCAFETLAPKSEDLLTPLQQLLASRAQKLPVK